MSGGQGRPPLARASDFRRVLEALDDFERSIEGCFCPALHIEVGVAKLNLAEAAEFDGLRDDA